MQPQKLAEAPASVWSSLPIFSTPLPLIQHIFQKCSKLPFLDLQVFEMVSLGFAFTN